MNRRKFLTRLGLAPAVLAASKVLPAQSSAAKIGEMQDPTNAVIEEHRKAMEKTFFYGTRSGANNCILVDISAGSQNMTH